MSMIALIVPAGRTLWEVSHGEHLKYKTIVLTPAFWRWMDPLLTIVLPLLSGASQLFVRTDRFDLIESYGCFPSYNDSSAGFILIYGPIFAAICFALVTCCVASGQIHDLERQDKVKLVMLWAIPITFLCWFMIHPFVTKLTPEIPLLELWETSFTTIAFRSDFAHRLCHIALWWAICASGVAAVISQILQVTHWDDVFLFGICVCASHFRRRVATQWFAPVWFRRLRGSQGKIDLNCPKSFSAQFNELNISGSKDIEMQSTTIDSTSVNSSTQPSVASFIPIVHVRDSATDEEYIKAAAHTLSSSTAAKMGFQLSKSSVS
ncbi:hypothetical protein DL96DRAFT_1612043 [Flagelloscypha sp. PMI_526]|nr:hypothetical protein DL96DRAFT_1612043 [Flagelloscypha sp. PMI_526]